MNYLYKLRMSTLFVSFYEYALHHGVTTSHVFLLRLMPPCIWAPNWNGHERGAPQYKLGWQCDEVHLKLMVPLNAERASPQYTRFIVCIYAKVFVHKEREGQWMLPTRAVTGSYKLMLMILYSDILLYRNWGKIEKQRDSL